MSGNFIIVAHLLGVIGSPRPQKCLQIMHCISRGLNESWWPFFIHGAVGFTESGRQLVRQQSEMLQSTLLLPCSYFFKSSSVLSRQTSISHTQICFSRSSFLRVMFCNDNALFLIYSHRANCMACLSVCATHAQSPVLWFVEEVYFCHKRNKTKREN